MKPQNKPKQKAQALSRIQKLKLGKKLAKRRTKKGGYVAGYSVF